MSDFFRNMNLARFIIVMTLPLSLGLGYFAWTQNQALEEKEDDLRRRVPKLVTSIQQYAADHSRLKKELRAEGLQGEASPASYIRGVAASNKVEIGDVKIDENTRTPFKGVEDRTFTIRPVESDRKFQRERISNFFFKLEDDSSRIKVTDISIDLVQKRIKNHEVPDDFWTFTGQVTSRQAAAE